MTPTERDRAVANLKRRTREALKRNLDPNWGDGGRCFPEWYPGMTTAEYIRRHQSLQSTRKVTFVHADRVAPEETWGSLQLHPEAE